MTAKQTAIRNTVLIFLTSAAVYVTATLILTAATYFTMSQIAAALLVLIISGMYKLVYDMELAKAQHRESLEQLKKVLTD